MWAGRSTIEKYKDYLAKQRQKRGKKCGHLDEQTVIDDLGREVHPSVGKPGIPNILRGRKVVRKRTSVGKPWKMKLAHRFYLEADRHLVDDIDEALKLWPDPHIRLRPQHVIARTTILRMVFLLGLEFLRWARANNIDFGPDGFQKYRDYGAAMLENGALPDYVFLSRKITTKGIKNDYCGA